MARLLRPWRWREHVHLKLWRLECDRFLTSLQSSDVELRRNYSVPSVFHLHDIQKKSGILIPSDLENWIIVVGEILCIVIGHWRKQWWLKTGQRICYSDSCWSTAVSGYVGKQFFANRVRSTLVKFNSKPLPSTDKFVWLWVEKILCIKAL